MQSIKGRTWSQKEKKKLTTEALVEDQSVAQQKNALIISLKCIQIHEKHFVHDPAHACYNCTNSEHQIRPYPENETFSLT